MEIISNHPGEEHVIVWIQINEISTKPQLCKIEVGVYSPIFGTLSKALEEPPMTPQAAYDMAIKIYGSVTGSLAFSIGLSDGLKKTFEQIRAAAMRQHNNRRADGKTSYEKYFYNTIKPSKYSHKITGSIYRSQHTI